MSHADGDEKNYKAYHIMVQNWPFAGQPQSVLFFSQCMHFYRYGPLAWMACSRRGFTKDLLLHLRAGDYKSSLSFGWS